MAKMGRLSKRRKSLLSQSPKLKVIYFIKPTGKRQELIENLANLDHEIEELYLHEKPIDEATLKRAIRR